MQNINIYQESNIDKLNILAAESLSNIIKVYKDKPILLLLSGGSSLNIIPYLDNNIFSENITISVMDERYSFDRNVSNFHKLISIPIIKENQSYIKFIDTRPINNEKIEDLDSRINDNLLHWIDINKDGKIIGTFGIGIDGHIAGVMPYKEDKEFFNNKFLSKELMVYYDAKDKNPFPLRITTTLTFIKNYIIEAIIYVTGENKKQVLQTLLNDDKSLEEIPSKIIFDIPNVSIFTDIIIKNQ